VLAEETLTVYHSTDQNNLNTLRTQWEKDNMPEPEPVILPKDLDPKKLYNRE